VYKSTVLPLPSRCTGANSKTHRSRSVLQLSPQEKVYWIDLHMVWSRGPWADAEMLCEEEGGLWTGCIVSMAGGGSG